MELFNNDTLTYLLTLIGIVQAVVVAPIVFAFTKLSKLQKEIDSKVSNQLYTTDIERVRWAISKRVTDEAMKEYVSLKQEPLRQMCDSIKQDVEFIRRVLEERRGSNE